MIYLLASLILTAKFDSVLFHLAVFSLSYWLEMHLCSVWHCRTSYFVLCQR